MIQTVRDDITQFAGKVDAICNAANESLLGGGGVDGAIHRAADYGIKTIAFPSISTGVYHFPVQKAAKIAVQTVQKYLNENPGKIDQVWFVLFDQRTEAVYDMEVDMLYKNIEF